MKYAKYMIAIMALCFVLPMRAQNDTEIEPAIMEIIYQKRKVTDTLDRRMDYNQELMSLRVGKNVSMFYSIQDLWADSLKENNVKLWAQMIGDFLQKKSKKGVTATERERVYKNYPEGKVTVYNHFSLMHWKYTEDWEKPEWTLIDESKPILGYECQLAQCKYRGRIWYAWFTLDIPIGEGPWKLCGLPGMILEAYDMKKDYVFTAQEIRTQNIMPVGIYYYSEYNWAETKHNTYYKTWYKALHEDLGYVIVSSGAYGLDSSKIKAPRKLPHKNYDFEETDYHDK